MKREIEQEDGKAGRFEDYSAVDAFPTSRLPVSLSKLADDSRDW
jgi:hypothetical protein